MLQGWDEEEDPMRRLATFVLLSLAFSPLASA